MAHKTLPLEAFQKILDMIPSPVFVKDSSFRMVFMNEAIWSLSDLPRGDVQNVDKSYLVTEEQKAVHKFWDEHVMTTGETVEYEESFTVKGGEQKIGIIRKTQLILGPPPGEAFLVGILSDITAHREAAAKSEHLARHDTLTGLPNRMFFQQRLERAMADPTQLGNLAILLVDLDEFKAVNDTHGHGMGDRLLCRIAHRLKKTVRETDMVARLGGDEFGILLKSAPQSSQAAVRVAEAICRIAANPVRMDEVQAKISASVGVAYFVETGTSPNELMHQADIAMYRAKRGGRDGVREYAPEMEAAATV